MLHQIVVICLYCKGKKIAPQAREGDRKLHKIQAGELTEDSVCAKFARTAADGKTYHPKFCNLDAIIAVGFRTDSERAIQFRRWATRVLRLFSVRGYVLDRERIHNA